MELKKNLKVYELSSKINCSSKEIISIAHKLNFNIHSIKCTVETDEEEEIYSYLKKHISKDKTIAEKVRESFQSMKIPEDLVDILNLVNKNIYGEKASSLELKFLTYHAFHSKNKYKEFLIPKKSGGNRKICAPTKSLKNILSTLNTTFHYIYNAHNSSHGFEKEKSVITNAKQHINKNYVYNIDLKDFFTNISQARVHKKLQLPPFNIKAHIADLISNLVCYKSEDSFYIDKNNYKNNNYLAQGFPTSPILSNIICERLDRRLTGLAKRFSVQYSRYADDMTFSSDHNVYSSDSEFIIELNRIIQNENFEINLQKTRLQKKGFKQEVTGIIVNSKTNVRRSYIKQLRTSIYILEKFDIKEANKIFIKNKIIKDSKKNYALKYISGKLEYLRMVKGEYDPTYIKLKQRFDKCTKKKVKEEKPIHKHNPKKLVEILSSFTKDNNDLKFTTHNWDMQDENERFPSFDDFIEKIKIEWKKISKDIAIVSPRLYAKIHSFLFNPLLGKEKKNGEIDSWGLHQIKFGWSSPQLKEWTDKGNPPFEYELEKDLIQEIDGKTISIFMHIVEIFKKEIEIRTAQNDLKNIFYKKINFLGPDFSIKLKDLEGVDFYTDVQWFQKALNQIFSEIKTRAEHPEVNIGVIKNTELKTVEIYISQVGSMPNKTVNEMKEEIEDGHFETIYTSLKSLCDWSIEAEFSDGAYRINYLTDTDLISTQKLDPIPAGFTHILKFYK